MKDSKLFWEVLYDNEHYGFGGRNKIMKKLTSFNVMAELKTTSSITIEAESLLDAVEKAKLLKDEDFITVEGEYMDGELRITGVYE